MSRVTHVELRGRLNKRDLAFLSCVRARLQLGLPVRLLAICILLVLLGGVGFGLQRSPPTSGNRTGEIAFAGMLIVLLDLIGLRFARYQVTALVEHRRALENVVRFDERGVSWAPVENELKYMSFGWPLLDVLSLREGVVVAFRSRLFAFVYIPQRVLFSADRHAIEDLARRNGGRVLSAARGHEIPASSSKSPHDR